MWALGAVAYMLLSGVRPFHSDVRAEKARMIRDDPLTFPPRYWQHISQQAKDFCSALMQKQPSNRLSASEAIKHPWIRAYSRAHSEPGDAARALPAHRALVEYLF